MLGNKSIFETTFNITFCLILVCVTFSDFNPQAQRDENMKFQYYIGIFDTICRKAA